MDTKLTIFTPAYNRAYTLPTLYESLLEQTCKDFIWIIVNDGSSDNTDKVVSEWLRDNKVNIIYQEQTNQGKMSAHNTGVTMCTTEYFVCVDSDDYLVPDAVEYIYSQLDKCESKQYAGLVAYKGTDSNTPIGNEFPTGLYDKSLSGLYQLGFKGDTTLVFKTSVLQKYPFPVLDGEKFISEAYVYDQIDRSYTLILSPKVITICEYLPDGLTCNGMSLVINNPGGWAMVHCQKANFADNFKTRFKNYAWAISYKLMKRGAPVYLQPQWKLAYFLALPLGAILYLRRIIVHRK